MSTYVIVQLFEKLQPQSRFSRSQWPLHLTLVPNFSIAADGDRVTALISEALSGFDPFTVRAIHDDLLGAAMNVPVTLIRPTPALTEMHETLVQFLRRSGAVFVEEGYINTGYRPHVTIQKGRRVYEQQVISIDGVTIADLTPGGRPELATIVDTLPL